MAKKSGSKFVDKSWEDYTNYAKSNKTFAKKTANNINSQGRTVLQYKQGKSGSKNSMWDYQKSTINDIRNRVNNGIRKGAESQTSEKTSLKGVPAKSNKPTSHTIKQGETLGSIAKHYGVDWRTLASDNGISDPNMIVAGRKLNINGATKAAPKKKAAPARRKQSLERTKPIVYPSNGPTRVDIASAYADRLQGALDSLDARAINTQVPTQALGYANQPSFRGASLDDIIQMGY